MPHAQPQFDAQLATGEDPLNDFALGQGGGYSDPGLPFPKMVHLGNRVPDEEMPPAELQPPIRAGGLPSPACDCQGCNPAYQGPTLGWGWWKHRWNCRIKPHHQWTHWGYPEEFEEPSLGAALYSHMGVQITRGQTERMVLYHYDFYNYGNMDLLNPRGKYQLQKISRLLPLNHLPVIIEQTPKNPQLDEARRREVLNELARMEVHVADERVQIGRPTTRGMSGMEAIIVDQNMLQQTQSRGATTIGGSDSASGFDASGIVPGGEISD